MIENKKKKKLRVNGANSKNFPQQEIFNRIQDWTALINSVSTPSLLIIVVAGLVLCVVFMICVALVEIAKCLPGININIGNNNNNLTNDTS